MPGDECSERLLFGGAISSAFPMRFQDLSSIREVPDHQEVFADSSRDESLFFELLDLKNDVSDSESAIWFLQDLANEQDAKGSLSGSLQPADLMFKDLPAVITTVVGRMAVSKGRQGREAQNVVRVYLANLRLKAVGTDVLIIAYEPILINALSETSLTVGAGLAVPAAQSELLPVSEVFKFAIVSFKVNDWNLFGVVDHTP
ncbi:uncharacterized protein LOC116256022 isoform X2 [Nymphaea colorata]|uniref:uncharacterized protein LOC116256022 isoform X2 n=1 Tax=Nymphaea colorata TaxID=210225 RepID=UPI00129D7A47|nr:uncharacterized protein LOC116256022 isoform X2 [Nymphaea colorata]